MDENIQVCAVFTDGTVKIFGVQHKPGQDRQYIQSRTFPSYGKALQFAIEYEDKQRR